MSNDGETSRRYASVYTQSPPAWHDQLRALLFGDVRQIRSLLSSISGVLRARWQLRRCSHVGRFVQVIGKVMVTTKGGTITLGHHTRIRGEVAPVDLRVHTGGRIDIGDYCFINHGTEITAAKHVRIGTDCLFGPHCFILDTHYHDPFDHRKHVEPLPVTIGNDVWLGAHVIVLAGVSIGDGASIGAGSVVTHDIPPHCLAAGNPARVLRMKHDDDPDEDAGPTEVEAGGASG